MMRTFKVYYDAPDPEWAEVPDDVTDDELESYVRDNAPTATGFVSNWEEWV